MNQAVSELVIRFSGDATHLYEIGFLTGDVCQLVAFAGLLADERISEVRNWSEGRVPRSRYSAVLEEYRKRATVSKARDGSVELIVSVPGVIAQVIAGVVAIKIAKALDTESVDFQISVSDFRLRKVLDAYEQGKFGSGERGWRNLSAQLANEGYDVQLLATNAYAIENVTNRFSQRMVRTLKRP